ncbi:MAG: ankyrin repeat domain-containing protein, partial [Firmicutes bacterium]|nr:ankyrin repeat domain-containing protein [Bacillota bacterium]
ENDLIDEKHKNFLLQSYLKVLTKKKDSKDLKNIFKLVKKSSKDKINKLFDEKEIKFLFKENVDMKVESEVEKEKENEETILIYTIKEGYPVTALESLNNNKENINSRDNYGKTALMYASEKGYEELVTKLLEKKGINLDLKDKDGYTALDYAKNKEIRELLIEKGAKNGVRIK